MRSSSTNILISTLMILVFTTFNAGIPVVISLCPMMDDDTNHCEMMPPATHGTLSFTSEIPDCCTSHIVAERNTIPYLSVEQYKVSHLVPLDQVALVSNESYLVHGQPLLTEGLCVSASPPFRETVSLSILNSTLLI
jgi:hypothetical protein